MARFDGKAAIVTGAAGGIGRAIVQQLVSEGARVGVIDCNGNGLADLVRGASADIVSTVADLASVDSAREAVSELMGRLGQPVDVVVNAAGVYALAPALQVQLEDWEFNQSINLRAAFFVSQAVIAAREDDERCMAVVHISSTGALRMGTGDAALSYGASKAGLLGLTVGMAVEWARRNIRVNVVVPGVIDTAMVRLMDDPQAGRAWLDARVPMDRLGRPDEVAKAVCFLASEDASYITGASLVVDGGYLCV